MTVNLQEKKGVYYAVFRVADAGGNMKQKWVSTKIPVKRGTKREAMRAAQEIADQYEDGQIVSYPSTQFWKWIEMWLEQKRLTIDVVTYQGYLSYYTNHIGPYFKAHPVTLTSLSPQDIQRYYNNKAQKPGEHVKGKLSGKSLHDHHAVIRGALHDAVMKNIIPFNPAERVTLPKKERFNASFYTKDQIAKLLEASKGTPIEGILLLTIFYGLRRSEAVGLKWSAVDFEHDTFCIASTIVRFSGLVEKDKTKTSASHSTYPMAPEIKTMLLKLRQHQNDMRELCGKDYVETDYVFTWDDGRVLNPDYVSRKFSQILIKAGLPHIRYHDLRHTTASLLIEDGFDLKRVQEWLRHSDIGTTMNIYGHLSYEAKKATSAAMSTILGPSSTSVVQEVC